jgi:hypothetical protein
MGSPNVDDIDILTSDERDAGTHSNTSYLICVNFAIRSVCFNRSPSLSFGLGIILDLLDERLRGLDTSGPYCCDLMSDIGSCPSRRIDQ